MRNTLYLIVFAAGLALGALLTWKLLEVSEPPVRALAQPQPLTTAPPSRVPVAETRATAALPDLAELSSYASEYEQSLALMKLLEGRDVDGILRLLDEAGRSIQGSDYFAATSIMLGRIAELDLDRAVAIALDAAPSERNRWIHSIFHSAARMHPERAAEAYQRLSPELRQIAGAAMTRSVDHLPLTVRRALAEAINAPTPIADARLDPVGAWAAAIAERDLSRRAQLMSQVAIAWSETDPASAMQALSEQPSMARQGIEMQILNNWIRRDLDAAWRWLEGRPRGDHLHGLYQIAIRRTAEVDLERAKAIAATLDPQLKGQAMQAIARSWVRSDPFALAEWVNTQLSERDRQAVVSTVAGQMALESPEHLEAWVASLDDESRALADMAIVNFAGRQNPAVALAHLERITAPDERRRARRYLMTAWSASDPEAARAWYETLPAEAQADVARPLVQGWARWQPEAALRFARRIEDATTRETALVAIANQAAGREPDMLISIYEQLDAPRNRQRVGRILYHRLKDQDPERARLYEAYEREQTNRAQRSTR